MSKLYKAEIYITDVNDDFYSIEDVIEHIKYKTDLSIDCFDSNMVEFEWDDRLPINFTDCPKEEFEKFFILR